jgi:hypothetical protein
MKMSAPAAVRQGRYTFPAGDDLVSKNSGWNGVVAISPRAEQGDSALSLS